MNKLSIIVPCYNEGKTILWVIQEIEQFKSKDKEIIIVDDGSTDNTKALPVKINFITQPIVLGTTIMTKFNHNGLVLAPSKDIRKPAKETEIMKPNQWIIFNMLKIYQIFYSFISRNLNMPYYCSLL